MASPWSPYSTDLKKRGLARKKRAHRLVLLYLIPRLQEFKRHNHYFLAPLRKTTANCPSKLVSHIDVYENSEDIKIYLLVFTLK